MGLSTSKIRTIKTYGTVGSEPRRCCLKPQFYIETPFANPHLCWLHPNFITIQLQVLVGKKNATSRINHRKSINQKKLNLLAFARSKNGCLPYPPLPLNHLEGPAIAAHHLQHLRPCHHLRRQPIAGGASGLGHWQSALQHETTEG